MSKSFHHSSVASRILQLPVHLANQIAAGEVIERPASVIKELVENSIDAGATQIDISVEAGGTLLIKVIDNGVGIHRDDLLIALSPHATSKIRQTEDLEELLTLGFRGEALASISSVARIKLQSRQADDQSGWCVGTGIEEAIPTAIPVGTHIEVRELFYNTPARKRFLRTERTEYLQVEEIVRRLILSHFECGFSFNNNGKALFNLPIADSDAKRESRVRKLFGKRFIESSRTIEYEVDGLSLHGWIGQPGYSLSQSDRQYVYLNGRTVKDRVISHALRQAYNNYLDPGRHPSYLLYFQIDPMMVDVNVHPTKHEVRFRDARRIHDFLAASMNAALADNSFEPEQHNKTETDTNLHRYNDPDMVRQTLPHYLSDGRGSYHHERTSTQAYSSQRADHQLHLIDGRFMIVNEPTPLIIDMYTMHHDHLAQRFSAALKGEPLVSQPLLFPLSFSLETSEQSVIESILPQLLKLGFDLSIEKQTITLRQMPELLRGIEPQQLLKQLSNTHGDLIESIVCCAQALPQLNNQAQLFNLIHRYGFNNLEAVIEAGYAKVLSAEVIQRLFEDE